MGFMWENVDGTPKGWDNWYLKRVSERYREARRLGKLPNHHLVRYELNFKFSHPLDHRKPEASWILFVDRTMRERNEELEEIAEKMNVARVSFFVGDHLERNQLKKCLEDYEEIVAAWKAKNYMKELEPWVFLNKEQVERNEELYVVQKMHRVRSMKNSRSFCHTLSNIETKKCQETLNRTYQHFKRNERRRKALKKITNTRNTTGFYKSNDSEILEKHPDNCWRSFSFDKRSQHPIRPGFTFGY